MPQLTQNLAGRLKKRSEFLRVGKGRKFHSSGFSLQMCQQPENTPDDDPRFGFTVTKKEGGAVERNRMRRRFREIVRQTGMVGPVHGHDYVIVSRRDSLNIPFHSLASDLRFALRKIHAPKSERGPKDRKSSP